MASILGLAGMIIGTAGIFFGFYYLDTQQELALQIVTLAAVGAVGLTAFIRHVIFYKSDMKRLGWETDRPDWMFEVGFANLAFAAAGFIAALAPLGKPAMTISLAAYSIYLLQASILHGYRYFTDQKKSTARLWRSCLSTLLYSAMLGYFAVVSV